MSYAGAERHKRWIGAGMELDLECVASFVLLCEERHFGRAASRLYMTSSALTKRLQRLEHQLGVQLVLRGPGGTSALTPSGGAFLPHAKAALKMARSAQAAALSRSEASVRHILRVGLPGALPTDPTMTPLMRLLDLWRERVPGGEIACFDVPYGRIVDHLLGNKVDMIWSPSAIEHPDLSCRSMGAAYRVGIVPDHHPFADRGVVDAEEFATLPLLCHPGIPHALMAPGLLTDVRPRSEARVVIADIRGLGELKSCILRGEGVAVFPAILGASMGTGLRSVALINAAPVDIHAIYRRWGSSRLLPMFLEALPLPGTLDR